MFLHESYVFELLVETKFEVYDPCSYPCSNEEPVMEKA